MAADSDGKTGAPNSAKKDIVAHGIFSIWVFGSFIPIFVMGEQYWEAGRESMSSDYIQAAVSLYQPWLAPVMVIACVVFGMIGAWLGLKIMKKHFVKAGIV